MKLSTVRDLAVIGGAIVFGWFAADEAGLLDNSTPSQPKDSTPAGTHGRLLRVGGSYSSGGGDTFLRPATAAEAEASRAAADVDGGPGVFAVVHEHAGEVPSPRYVMPGTPAWDALLTTHANYYRVEAPEGAPMPVPSGWASVGPAVD